MMIVLESVTVKARSSVKEREREKGRERPVRVGDELLVAPQTRPAGRRRRACWCLAYVECAFFSHFFSLCLIWVHEAPD